MSIKPARLRAYIFLLTAVVIWAIAAPIIKFTLNGISPFVFLIYRFAIASVAALILTRPKELLAKPIRKHFSMIILYALLSVTFGLGFLFLGLEQSTVLDLSLIGIIGPLLLSIAGVVFLHERISHREKIGSAIAVVGMIVVVIAPLIMNHGNQIRFSGNLFIVFHILSDIASIIILKKIVNTGVSALAVANIAFLVGFVTVLPYAIYLHGFDGIITQIRSLSLAHHAGVWYMALLSGTVAYYLRNRAQKTIEVSEASLFGYLGPLITTPLAVLWLGEQITASFIIGAIVIATGVFIAETR